jgi:hypothetical protein
MTVIKHKPDTIIPDWLDIDDLNILFANLQHALASVPLDFSRWRIDTQILAAQVKTTAIVESDA